MPNTAVKAANAESTWGEAPWEDRKPLIYRERSTSIMKCFFFCMSRLVDSGLDISRESDLSSEQDLKDRRDA